MQRLEQSLRARHSRLVPTLHHRGPRAAVTTCDDSQHALVHALPGDSASIARHVHATGGFNDSLSRITADAKQTIGGCEASSISLCSRRSGPVTFAPTDPMALYGDQTRLAESEESRGGAGLQVKWVSTPDLATDPRRPRPPTRTSMQLGERSTSSCRMTLDATPSTTLGGANSSATRTEAFTSKDQMLIPLLSCVGDVVDAAREQHQLCTGTASRYVGSEAIGILRAESNLTSQQASARLNWPSQRTNSEED